VVPEEIGFLAPGEWNALQRIVDKIVRAGGGTRDGTVVRLGDQTLNLGNLARTCHQLPRGEWAGAAERFFAVLTDDDRADPVAVVRDDPDVAQSLLRVRPYPEEMFKDIPFRVVRRPFVGELVDVVCLDFPDHVAMVNADMAAAFRVPEADLFAIGLANVHADGPPQHIDSLQLEPGVALDVFMGETFYGASWGRWVDELVPGLGADGALVVLPLRDQIGVHALHPGQGALVAPGRMLWFAHLGVSDGIGPLTPELFWWRDGQLTHLPGGWAGDRIRFAPTDEYLAVAEQLAAPG
jgi:hypothetical protein